MEVRLSEMCGLPTSSLLPPESLLPQVLLPGPYLEYMKNFQYLLELLLFYLFSGPSSIESQKNNVYDETLVVIEKSNKELEKKLRPSRMVDTIHNNKNSLAQEVIYEVESMENTTLSIPSPQKIPQEIVATSTVENGSSIVAPSYPSISDLTLTDITCFKSLTAQKMMAGLSFNSIDTLLEVNAAAEARSKLNESTETVDFGII